MRNSARKFFPLVILGFLMFAGAAWGAQTEPFAGKVDVYPRGALMTMEFEASPDMNIELPLTFEPGSIRVSGGEGVTVVDFDTDQVARPGWVPPALGDLADAMKTAQSQVDKYSSRAAAFAQARKHLDESPPEGLSGAELEAFIDAAIKKRESVELKAAQTAASLGKAKREYDLLKGEYDSRFPGDPDRILLVSARTEGSGKVTLTAWTNSASWHPVYRMELDSASGEIDGVIGAEISQKSGITWDGDILLHTVRPRGGIDIPDMRPLVVDFLQISPAPKALRMQVEEMASTMDSALGREAFMEEGLTDVSLKTRGKVWGSGQTERLDVGPFKEKADVSLVCIPEFSNEAWTVATVASTGMAFLPGEARVSVDGKDTGVARIPARSRGQELRLPFGTTPLVTAKREEMLPTTGSSWIIKGKHQRGYVITVSNGLKEKISLKVMDRIPVPAQDSIKVQDVILEPVPGEKDDKGFLTWEIDLEKGQSRKISVKYTVTYPSDKELMFR